MKKEKYTDISLTDEQLALIGIKSKAEPEQYIQVNDTRYTLDEFNRVGDFLLGRNFQKPKELAEKVREYALDVVDPIPAPEGAAFDHWIDGWKDCQANIRGLVKDLNRVPSLTGDQQTVLKALKVDQDGWYPFFTIWHMMENDEISSMPTKQQFQVLAAFAEWGMEQEED